MSVHDDEQHITEEVFNYHSARAKRLEGTLERSTPYTIIEMFEYDNPREYTMILKEYNGITNVSWVELTPVDEDTAICLTFRAI